MNETDMTLLSDWDDHPIDGWFWSEKFDGCRAYWDGARFWTRGGNIIKSPKWITDEMPVGVPIDGELWAGRGALQTARVAVQHDVWTKQTRFVGFDAPGVIGQWDKRMAAVKQRLGGRFAIAADFGRVKNMAAAVKIFAAVGYAGGEGIVLRNPAICSYEKGRSKNSLRVKI